MSKKYIYINMETYKEIIFMSILMEIVNKYDLPNKKILVMQQLKKLFSLSDYEQSLLVQIMNELYEIGESLNSSNYYKILCDIINIL